MRKIRDAIGELLVLIHVPEKTGIVEAGFRNALVTLLDQAFGIAAGVHDGDKVRSKFARSRFHREIFLVMAHHRRENFRRKFQISRVEIAADGRGIFGDERERFEKIGIGFSAKRGDLRLDLTASFR